MALGMISLIVVVMLEMMLAMIVLVTNEVLRMRGRASSMMRTKVS